METVSTAVKKYDIQPGRRYALIIIPPPSGSWEIVNVGVGNNTQSAPLILNEEKLANITSLPNNSLQVEFVAVDAILVLELSGTFQVCVTPIHSN